MKYLIAAGVLAAGAAQAQEPALSIENCVALDDRAYTVECDVTNLSDTAVASFGYSVLITQPDRTVPWLDLRDGPPRGTSIGGGIEPGETIRELLIADNISSRADMAKIVIEVTPTEVYDVNDEPID